VIAYPGDIKALVSLQIPGYPTIDVIPRDKDQKRCAAYEATHWEVIAYYTDLGHDLDELAAIFGGMWAVSMTMVYKRPGDIPRWWPIHYRSTYLWRPQVRCLMQKVDTHQLRRLRVPQ
jgi:hypothetical protein